MFARSLSIALGSAGVRSILCFPSPPEPAVRAFLTLPNVTIEAAPPVFDSGFLAAGYRFLRLIRQYRPAVVHLHFTGLVSPFPWLARSSGVEKVFFTDHGSRSETGHDAPSALWKRLAKGATNRPIDELISVSGYVLESHLSVRDVPASRLRLIYNGVDLERARVAARTPEAFRFRFGIPEDRVLITQVSWLIEEKGVWDFVDAAKLVLAVCPDVHFCIVGAGPRLAELTSAVAAAGMESRFTFAGQSVDPFFDGVFSASDIICQPSRWQEAFGWVIGEAMAFGKPVVATRVGGIPEIVREHVTGFLVAGRDSVDLSRRLIELASDPGLRARMGRAGLKEVTNRFSLDRTVSEHLDLYGLIPRPERKLAALAGSVSG
jgi:glycosyltransferase involved in cell wall biosynthesis